MGDPRPATQGSAPGGIALLIDGTTSFESVAGNQSTASWFVVGIFMIPIAIVLWGPVVGGRMPCSTWPLAALSFLDVVRSLRPSLLSGVAAVRSLWRGGRRRKPAEASWPGR
ncbi:hypothetical protein ACQFYA_05170 [Promicromonospora sp. Marseille-Q5078]